MCISALFIYYDLYLHYNLRIYVLIYNGFALFFVCGPVRLLVKPFAAKNALEPFLFATFESFVRAKVGLPFVTSAAVAIEPS